MAQEKQKAVICIPTYNEREGIRELIPQIFTITEDIKNWDVHILIADDTSPDGTGEEVKKMQKNYQKLHLLVNKEKAGLGAAYIKAFDYAITKLHPDVIFEMDGDGQHTPKILPNFLKEIEKGADFVIGSRYIPGGSIPAHWALWRKFTSVVGSIFAKLTFMNFKINDWTSGYRCIKSDFLKSVLSEMKGFNGYVFQVALLDKAMKRHLTIAETPLNFTDRLEGESKMQSFQFMFDTLWYIFTNSSFVRFSITGFLGFLVDFGVAAILITFAAMHKPTANAISAEMAIIFNFFVNNFWSFSHKKLKGSYVRKFVKFNVVSSGSIVIQWAGLILALGMLGDVVYDLPLHVMLPSWIVYKVFIIALLVIPYSYFMYNTFIWKAPQKA